jgi:eukaryotic-like serine/threonine-protein kinase
LDTAFLRESLYGVAFLQADTTKMQEQVFGVAGKPGAEATLASFESDTEAFSGHLRKARDFSRRAVESAERAEGKERAAEWQMNSALREAEFGNATEASGETGLALGLASTRDVQVLAALALARVGDSARAQKIADELEKQNAFNTMIIGYWLPLSVRRSKSIAAILGRPSRFSGWQFPTSWVFPRQRLNLADFSMLPTFAARRICSCARAMKPGRSFRNSSNNAASSRIASWAQLAHLGLARAYAMQGDSAKARAAYQDFLTLWKNADPDIPILKQAKAEYAKLQ